MNNKTVFIVLFLIIFAGAFIRFYNLHNQGFFLWDEGMYMNEARFYSSIIKNIPFFISNAFNDSITTQHLTERIEGWPPSSAKPMHAFMIYLFTLIVGMHVYACKYAAATFGVLSIVMLFFLMRSMYGITAATVAAFFLTFSGYHIYVSRVGTPETNSAFFVLAAWYYYWKSVQQGITRTKYSDNIFCGLLLGVAITMCYRWIIVVPILWMSELIHYCKANAMVKKNILKRSLWQLAAFLVLPLICDIPYWLVRLQSNFSMHFRHMTLNVYSYFDQLLFYICAQSRCGVFYPHLLYVHLFGLLNSPVVMPLMILGICILIMRHKLQDFLIAAPGLIIFIILSLKTRGNMIRYCSLAIPFFAATTAVGFTALLTVLKTHKRITIIFVLLTIMTVAGTTIYKISDLLTITSGYKKLKTYLASQGGEQHLTPSNSISEFYFGRNVAEQIPASRLELAKILQKRIYKYVVLDFLSHRVLHPETKMLIEENCTPIASFENNIGTNYFIAMGSLGYQHQDRQAFANALRDPHAGYIDVYDAEDVFAVLSAHNRLTRSNNP